jgi:uncharacterized protein
MSDKPRYVVDTNVLVSAALFPHSVPRQVFGKVLKDGQLLLSADTFAEVAEVLYRPKLKRYNESDKERFLSLVVRLGSYVEPTQTIKLCRDPKDDKFLELALAGDATCIITGDKDLLELHPFQNIPIVSAKVFLESS